MKLDCDKAIAYRPYSSTLHWKRLLEHCQSIGKEQITGFADDADLVERGVPAVKESFTEMDKEANKIGLQVSEDKSKYLTSHIGPKGWGHVSDKTSLVHEYNFEVIQSFKCLGSIVNVTNNQDEEIKTRISHGNKMFLRVESSL